MTTFVVGLSNGKLRSSNLDGQFDLSPEGYKKMAAAMLAANKDEFMMMRSSSLDFPEEAGGEEGVDYGDLVSDELVKQSRIDLNAITIIECNICNCYHRADFRGDCRDDENRFGDPQDAANQLNRPVQLIGCATVMPEYPPSLLSDKTKIGKQAILLHTDPQGEVFLSMDNGMITLKRDGTWNWIERP